MIAAFLARAARAIAPGSWVFTGFHWPLLAADAARRRHEFFQVAETGAVINAVPRLLPSSTTEYPAFDGATCFAGSTVDILLGLIRKVDRVLLDAANVDLAGCVNATRIDPAVRLPGGGGAADAAAGARHLVLLNGGGDVSRIVARVDHVTARPRDDARVDLIARGGTVRLGDAPRLVERVEGEEGEALSEHLRTLGVDVDAARAAEPPAAQELAAAQATLAEAARRGYRVAR